MDEQARSLIPMFTKPLRKSMAVEEMKGKVVAEVQKGYYLND